MAPAFPAAVLQAMEEAIASCRLPGVIVALARGDGPADHLCLGEDAAGQPLDVATLQPVASVTKLATALALLRLVDRGVLALDEPLGRHLPEAAAAVEGVTLRRLLAHTAGLPLDLPPGAAPYRRGLDWLALSLACLEIPPERAPGSHVQYSNVGYGLLALVVERVTGQAFPEALQWLVLRPLGIEGYLGDEPPRPPAVVADVRSEHAATELEPFNSPFWRSLALPWAGLLTTVDGALALVRAFAGIPGGFLRPETAAEARRNQAGDLGGGLWPPLVWRRCPWGLGAELRGEKAPHWTPVQAAPGSFGHIGYSGCIAWADPGAGLAWAVLSPRTADGGWLVRCGPAIGAAVLAT